MKIDKIIELLSEGVEADIWLDTGQQSTEEEPDLRAEQILIEEVQFAMCCAVALLQKVRQQAKEMSGADYK